MSCTQRLAWSRWLTQATLKLGIREVKSLSTLGAPPGQAGLQTSMPHPRPTRPTRPTSSGEGEGDAGSLDQSLEDGACSRGSQKLEEDLLPSQGAHGPSSPRGSLGRWGSAPPGVCPSRRCWTDRCPETTKNESGGGFRWGGVLLLAPA